jgi:hypothetical protein
MDCTERCTEFSAAGPQFIEYQVREGLEPGPYEIRAWVAVQERYRLSLSLVINGKVAAGPKVFDYTGGQGYGLFCLKARLALTGEPVTLRLAADEMAPGDRIRARRVEFINRDRLVADGNVARAAEVTVSSSIGIDYPAEAITDGLTEYEGTTRGRSWASAEGPAEQWVDLALAHPETLERVVLYWPKYPDLYHTARKVLVQVPAAEAWRTVGVVETRLPMPRSETTFPPFQADRVRLLMPAGMGALHRPHIFWLNEVELGRAGHPPAPRFHRTVRLSWSRKDHPLWPQSLKGGEVEGEMLVVLAKQTSLGRPRIEQVRPASARKEFDWWWDGVPLTPVETAPPTAPQHRLILAGRVRNHISRIMPHVPPTARVHRLIFAPCQPGVAPVAAITVSLPGEGELVPWDDFRAMPPPYEVTPRMTDAEFFAAVDLARPGLEQVAATVAVGDLKQAKAQFVSYVLNRAKTSRPRVCRLGAGVRPDENPDELAERLLHHEWYFYKYRDWRPLGQVINWHLPQGDGTDRHLLVEFNVMRFLVNRWEREGHEKWLRGYLDLFKQFYENAPSPARPAIFPANNLPWDGMGSAIRVRGLLEDYFRMSASPLLTVDDHLRVYKAALEHARYLLRHDGGQFFPANHQMGHLVALEVITATFPEWKEVAQWRPYLQRLLLQHLERDTFPDGGTVDTATGYGLWITSDLYTHACLYARDAGLDLGEAWRQRLEKMYEWCLQITTPDGGRLAVGDDHFHVGQGDAWGASSMGYKGALLFERPDFLWFASRPGAPPLSAAEKDSVAREVCGDRARRAMAKVARITPREPAFRSVNLPDTGMTVLRSDWTPQAVYLFVNHHRGGHCHKNQNDFSLVAYGRYFLTDPGMPHTFSDNRWQDWYVKTLAHNTVMVDEQDQDYGVGDRGRFFTSAPVDFLSVTHDCYKRLGIAGHQRSVLFIKDHLFLIDDCLTGTGRHQFSWLAHFQPMALRMDARQGLVQTEGGGPGLTIVVSHPGDLAFTQAAGWSDIPTTRPWQVCAEVRDAPYIALRKVSEVPAGYGAALVVDRGGAPAVRIQPGEIEGGVGVGAAYQVTWPGGNCEAAFCHGSPSRRSYGPLTTDGLAAAAVTRKDGSHLLFLLQGTEVANSGAALRLVGEAGSAAVEMVGETLRSWFEGHAHTLRIRASGVKGVTVNGKAMTFQQEGEEVVIALKEEPGFPDGGKGAKRMEGERRD